MLQTPYLFPIKCLTVFNTARLWSIFLQLFCVPYKNVNNSLKKSVVFTVQKPKYQKKVFVVLKS